MLFKTNLFETNSFTLTLTLKLETYSNKIRLSYLIPTARRLTYPTLTQGQASGPPYVTLTYLTLTQGASSPDPKYGTSTYLILTFYL